MASVDQSNVTGAAGLEVPKFVGRFVFKDRFLVQGGTLDDVFIKHGNEDRLKARIQEGFVCEMSEAYAYCSKSFAEDDDPQILQALKYQYDSFVVLADSEMHEAELLADQDDVQLYQREQKWICDGVLASHVSLSHHLGQWWLSVPAAGSSYSFDFKIGPLNELYHMRKLHLRTGDLMKTVYLLVELSNKE